MTTWEMDFLITCAERTLKILKKEISKKVNNFGIIGDIYDDILAIYYLLKPYKAKIKKLAKLDRLDNENESKDDLLKKDKK